MANPWKDFKTGDNPPDEIDVVVEIPKGSQNKFEIDPDTGAMRLDRVLHPPWKQGGWDYGLIPRTLSADGDPSDAIILMDEPSFPGAVVPCRPVGIMRMVDQGEKDDKVLCVPRDDPRTKDVKDLKDLPEKFVEELRHFYSNYKKSEGKEVEVSGFEDAEAAKDYIKGATELYKEKFGGK